MDEKMKPNVVADENTSREFRMWLPWNLITRMKTNRPVLGGHAYLRRQRKIPGSTGITG